jgi:hypothetical protein
MSARTHISLKTKLAAALLQMLRDDGTGKLIPVIAYDDAKLMTADQILSLYEWDHHPIRHADGGPSEPWNLVPRPIVEHRRKTATQDAPEMAKGRKITAAHQEFQRRMLAKAEGVPKPKSRWQSRPFPKRRKENAR